MGSKIMPNIYPMTLGDYETNCYIVWGEDAAECVVIDPGYEPERVLAQVKRLGKTLRAILLTHGHFDHVGGVKTIAAETGCDVYLSIRELTMPPQLTAGKLLYTQPYGQGDTLTLAGMTFQVLPTPGHTPGSVCLMTGDVLFSGDTLFAGSCGRTDLPGGSWEAILDSLRLLGSLSGDYTVYPGHGEHTKLSYERQYNPYMKGVL